MNSNTIVFEFSFLWRLRQTETVQLCRKMEEKLLKHQLPAGNVQQGRVQTVKNVDPANQTTVTTSKPSDETGTSVQRYVWRRQREATALCVQHTLIIKNQTKKKGSSNRWHTAIKHHSLFSPCDIQKEINNDNKLHKCTKPLKTTTEKQKEKAEQLCSSQICIFTPAPARKLE